ncbi:hypothetical protein SAMN00777080_5008 [Aquiflexum balticum DSM 16537]|uniref:Uncharacterized protein n=1 Tax=Aquiflexum balticum DSM 16537 TaxID=758820 RepID=A0A1W2HBS5_9BACT|nr:hypothetical protein SAMN00777080_5008 [Aquiflexum balticum DSM 16537]
MENSKLGLRLWLYLMTFMSATKQVLSALEKAFSTCWLLVKVNPIGGSQKTIHIYFY